MIVPSYNKDFLPDGYVRTESGLLCKQGYLDLSPEEKKKICNGIGAATGISSHIPSTIWGLDCSEAGNIHDYDYHTGGVRRDKDLADAVFLHNLKTLIASGTWALRWLRNNRANKYYLILQACGSSHFNYADKKKKK